MLNLSKKIFHFLKLIINFTLILNYGNYILLKRVFEKGQSTEDVIIYYLKELIQIKDMFLTN